MNKYKYEAKLVLRNIPGSVTTIFVVSVVLMNILANKSIINAEYASVTSGIALSWVSYLCMDCVCKYFGARAATILNGFAVITNLCASVLIAAVLLIPGVWASALGQTNPDVFEIVNASLDSTLSSTWYVVIGSSVAMFLGGVVNSFSNKLIGSIVDNSKYRGFLIRSSLSTALGQLVDNLVFAIFVSYVFFGWSIPQVIGCSVIGMVMELVIEVVFSPIGYRITRKWEVEGIGSEYKLYLQHNRR